MVHYCITSLDVKELRSNVVFLSDKIEDSVIELYHIIEDYEKENKLMHVENENRILIYSKTAGMIFGSYKNLVEILEIVKYEDEITES